MSMLEPPRIWWARPQKLCVLPRPGGGGRSHRPDRRMAEIAWMHAVGVRLIISTMPTRHNLQAYEDAGMQWHHVPIACAPEGVEALRDLMPFLNERLQQPGAIAIHADYWTDFPVAVCAAYLRESAGVDPVLSLRQACIAGLKVTPEACALLGVPHDVAMANGASKAPAASAPRPVAAAAANGASAAAVPGAVSPPSTPPPASATAGPPPVTTSSEPAPAIMPVSPGPSPHAAGVPSGAIPSAPPVSGVPDTPAAEPEPGPEAGPADPVTPE